MTDDPKPDGRPLYDLLADWRAAVVYVETVGADEFERRMKEEIREAMEELGVRVVLWYGERLRDVEALMGEHS